MNEHNERQQDAVLQTECAPVRLTRYSHGAGCGCKLAPEVLDKILSSQSGEFVEYPELLVGNSSRDDAAAFDLGNGTSVLSTTDFFMPIVDDPFTFGCIAAANALSDIYAMGGKPLMAIAILGWPIKLLPPEVAAKVVSGARSICKEAGIPLAGGHSIDAPEPIFGLAVTGIVQNTALKQNNQATTDCALFLTKPLGIGILSTAQKRDKLEQGDIDPAIKAMCTLNQLGMFISDLASVTAMTDVTGFGLLGHLGEVCAGSGISACIEFEKVSLLPHTKKYLNMDCVSGGTQNNFKSYGHTIAPMTDEQRDILCDAQPSGGLLIVVKKEGVPQFLERTRAHGFNLESIGFTEAAKDKLIRVL